MSDYPSDSRRVSAQHTKILLVVDTRISADRTNGAGFQNRHWAFVERLRSDHGDALAMLYLDDGSDSKLLRRDGDQTGIRSSRLPVDPYPSSALGRLRLHMSDALRPERTRWWEPQLLHTIRAAEPDVVVALLPFDPSRGRAIPADTPSVLVAEEDFTRGWAPASPLPWLMSKAITRTARRAWPRPDVCVVIRDGEVGWARRRFPGAQISVVPHFLDEGYWMAPVEPARDGADVFALGRFDERRNAIGMAGLLRALSTSDRPPTIAIASNRRLHASNARWSSPTVRVLGSVVDPRPYYKAARVCVVPALSVSGTKNQVLQGWATGTPVVASARAAASVGGVHGIELLVARSPAAAVSAIRQVMSSRALHTHLRDNGRRALLDRFSATHALQVFADSIDWAVEGRT